MTGRLTKLRRRRDTATSDPAGTAAGGSPAEQPTTVMPAAHAPLFADAAPAPEPAGPPLPADVAPGTQAAPGFRDRGSYRRRLRYLRRVRELGFRDLGGLVFDLHRFGRTGDEIVRAKLVALDAVDRELRALERVLRDEHAFTDLREPGVSACARCGALHGSDARFCPSCGISVGGPTALGAAAAAATVPAEPAGPGHATQPTAVAAPIMPLPAPAPEPEPELAVGPPIDAVPGAPAAEVPPPAPPEPSATDESAAVSAADTGSTPGTAAGLGLPVPTPPPVPPLPPGTTVQDGDAQPIVALPRVDTGDSAR